MDRLALGLAVNDRWTRMLRLSNFSDDKRQLSASCLSKREWTMLDDGTIVVRDYLDG